MNKKIIIALLLSLFLCPGMGQYWLGNKKRGVWVVSIVNLIAIIWGLITLKLTQVELGITHWKIHDVSNKNFEMFSNIAAASNNDWLNVCLALIAVIWFWAALDCYFMEKCQKF